MTILEKQNTLKKLFWDYEVQGNELQDVLQGKILRVGHIDKERIYSRMLSTLNWYIILDLAGTDHLDEVIRFCYRQALSEGYQKEICNRKENIIFISSILFKMQCCR